MFFDGSGRLDREWNDGWILLFHCSDGPLLIYFSVTGGSFSGRSLLGIVDGVEESLLEVSVWPEAAWAGHTEGPKLTARCFLLLRCSSEPLLKAFLATEVFS